MSPGATQLIPRETIGACCGGALLAAIGIGPVDPKTDWTVIDHKVEPDLGRRTRYDELYRLWPELYPATHEQMHRLGAWAKQA
jgi:xylulokinase